MVVDGAENLGFVSTASPRASIVIPVYGKADMTLVCLGTLAQSGDAVPFEIIVVDDCSPDGSATRIAAVPGVRVVSTPSNLGFVGACNLGAQHATGEFIVFLNNDTMVHPHWLDLLVEVFDTNERAGAVGSMTVGPDGLVQESGGIIWADGTGWNFGRGMSPSCGAVRSRRTVDYCSGAALAVRRSVFEQLGGFDNRYSPAYYEDTDLCFGVRSLGLDVIVQPESVVCHFEGSSNGADGEGGFKRFQAVNRIAFLQKWRRDLANHRTHHTSGDVWASSNRAPNGMALVVEPVMITPDRDSGSRRMSAMLDQMLDLGLAVFFAAANGVAIEPYRSVLERKGVTVLGSHTEQQEFLEQAGCELRLVLLCRPDNAWRFIDRIYEWAPQATLVYDTVDLHGVRMARQATVLNDQSMTSVAHLMWVKERAAMNAADVTLVVSPTECEWLRRVVPDADVRVLSNIHEPVVHNPTIDGRSGIMFVGGYGHPPNVDAAEWMINEVMPLVVDLLPDAVLRLVGSFLPAHLADLASESVDPIGWAPDLAPLYRETRVVVAPLRYGAGVKGKVAEAIEHGLPVVGTTVAFEGMGFRDGVDVMVGDTPAELAAGIVALLTDDERWVAMAGAAQERLLARFSPEIARRTLAELISLRRSPEHRLAALTLDGCDSEAMCPQP